MEFKPSKIVQVFKAKEWTPAPEDRISDVSKYGPPEHKQAVVKYTVNIPIVLVYKLFNWIRRKIG
jgi:hypothetical protein